jgi:hypothetical protein
VQDIREMELKLFKLKLAYICHTFGSYVCQASRKEARSCITKTISELRVQNMIVIRFNKTIFQCPLLIGIWKFIFSLHYFILDILICSLMMLLFSHEVMRFVNFLSTCQTAAVIDSERIRGNYHSIRVTECWDSSLILVYNPLNISTTKLDF